MNKELSIFESKVAVPAHLAAMFGDQGNIESGPSVPALTIRGKVFRINMDGEETALTRYDESMEDHVPVNTLSLVVLNQGPFGARVYYPGAYSPENTSGPKCYSLDGKYPDNAVAEPEADSCASCPHSVKGSKITPSGTATTACQLQRRLAVIPANKPEFTALLLRLAPTSAYDPETKNASSGWFAWRQYMDFLNSRGIRHTAQVVTKVRFDSNAEHPKLLFRPERFLTEEEAKIVAPRVASEEVNALILPNTAPAAPRLENKPGASIMGDDEETPAPTPAPAPKRKPAPKAKVEAEAEVESGVPMDKPTRKTAAGSKAAPPPPPEKSGVDALLDDWDA